MTLGHISKNKLQKMGFCSDYRGGKLVSVPDGGCGIYALSLCIRTETIAERESLLSALYVLQTSKGIDLEHFKTLCNRAGVSLLDTFDVP